MQAGSLMQKLAKVNIVKIQKTALRTFLGAVFVARPAWVQCLKGEKATRNCMQQRTFLKHVFCADAPMVRYRQRQQKSNGGKIKAKIFPRLAISLLVDRKKFFVTC